MEVLGTVALEVLKCIWGSSSRRIRDAKNLKKNLEDLNKKVEMLQARMEDINQKISGKKATRECEYWLKEADKIQSKRKEIEEEYQKNKTCLGGWCPNVSSSLNLGRRTVALTQEADDSIQRSYFKEDIVINEPPKIMEMPARTVEFNTAADRKLQELLGMLKEESIKKIGLCGMGGVGKTTLMKVLNNHSEIKEMFEIVLWVTVSKEGNNRKVQNELAQRLNVQIQGGESSELLRSKVFEKLKDKKFLLLLDDVWNMIDLEAEVGVPHVDVGNTGSKVVLSTRYLTVCHNMRTNKEINVKPLSKEEAWSLFRREVGEIADSPEIEPLAKQVAEECCGLPLAVVVLAGALRNEEEIPLWRSALNALRSSASTEIENMEEKVYQRLQYSYDRLKDERSKECFLYCALFPEDHQIPKAQLVEYWINEGLIDGWNNLEEAVDKGLSKVKELMNASLLEKGGADVFQRDCVKMHDVMRDLALRISSAKSEGCRSLVKAGVKFSQAPKEEDWEKARRISLMHSDLEAFPHFLPKCCMLTTLLLQNNYLLQDIAPNFFEHMPALQVLDLSRTSIEFLPPSIGNLANLRGLYLNDCVYLKVIPSQVGGLSKLEIFQMKGWSTGVCYLPPEMEDMVSLKHFEVCCGSPWTHPTNSRVMNVFPRMSKLSGLERLGIQVRPKDREWWDKKYSEQVSREISMLSKLTYLFMKFPKIEDFELFVRGTSSLKLGRLTSFGLLIGQDQESSLEFNGDGMTGMISYRPQVVSFFDCIQGKRMLVWNDGTRINVSDEVREILTCVDALVVGNRVAVENLSDFGTEKMSMVKDCMLIACEGMETIIFIDDDVGDNGKQKRKSDLLPTLQKLILSRLPKLNSIWKGPIPHPHQRRCFSTLRFLHISFCDMLKRIFSRGLTPHLSNLEEMEISCCWKVEEIIRMEEEEEMVPIQVLLPRLKKLYLWTLPELRFIICGSKEVCSAGWPSLEIIEIRFCGMLKSLPLGFAKAPNLQKIHCEASCWEALEWEDDAVKQQLCSKAVTYHMSCIDVE